jgi:hypothetical protein
MGNRGLPGAVGKVDQQGETDIRDTSRPNSVMGRCGEDVELIVFKPCHVKAASGPMPW